MEDIQEHDERNEENTILNINKPGLLTRIKSTLLDAVFIIFLMYLAFELLSSFDIQSGKIRGITLFIILLYEPIMVTIDRTLGQKIMGLRVRDFTALSENDHKNNINFFFSIIRYITKLLLGWISLLTIHADENGQAIHDYLGKSVMTVE